MQQLKVSLLKHTYKERGIVFDFAKEGAKQKLFDDPLSLNILPVYPRRK